MVKDLGDIILKHLMVVLDSCRYDLFNELYQNNELPFFQRLGEPLKSYTCSNVTSSSFVLSFSHGVFPYPQPRGFGLKRQINLVGNFKGKSMLVTGMPMIWPRHLSVKSTMAAFDEVDFRRNRNVCLHGVRRYNELEEKPDLFVLWCGETHHPYEVEQGTTSWYPPKINAYNRGKDSLEPEYFEYLKSRQKHMIAYCDANLSLLELDEPIRISLTADHGESMGEEHRIGHGNSIHPVQFTVPFQCGVI